ncbi:bifunctional DNA primase/polymerase [Actinoplanes sp. M2I2]|uniref:bifunctional DNA primase/polymerase n=1 Tax=Actinoplanes sp. M2I2 TaxID=1734444 RepID=UPI0027DFE98F|nr:bifunctional DNA primase/polymerase [Actinoplanes sp. M2I2]
MSGSAALPIACAAGCGVPLHPAAAAGGHDRHPGCEPATATTVDRWQCWRCLMTGTALNAAYGLAMVRIHDLFACPMTAGDNTELLKRLGRRAPLTRLYPTEVPALTARRTPSGRLQAIADGVPPPHPLKGPVRMPDTGPLLAAALALAAEGYPVFLLGRTKRPVANCPACPKADADPSHDPETCECLTCHGFYAATRDPDRITAMHRAVPAGLLAIRTGTASGLAVVDIDPRNGGTVLPELMPPTRCVRTGSGGWHLYYRHPGGTLAAKLHGHPGIDLKADGGYVVAPPSIHPSTRQPYRWVGDRPVIEMPPPLLAACRPTEAPAPPAAGPTETSNGRGISSPPALLAAHLDAVTRAPEGRRRNTLYGAARGVARMVAAGALTATDAHTALYAAGRAAGQSDRDTHAAITGGFRAESVATEGLAA